MRISDWSSDVCSSDLQQRQAQREKDCAGAPRYRDRQVSDGGGSRAAAQPEPGEAAGDDGRHLADRPGHEDDNERSEEHTSELQSLMRISYAVFCLKKKNKHIDENTTKQSHNSQRV